MVNGNEFISIKKLFTLYYIIPMKIWNYTAKEKKKSNFNPVFLIFFILDDGSACLLTGCPKESSFQHGNNRKQIFCTQ